MQFENFIFKIRWCGPFALGSYFLPLWHESPKTDTCEWNISPSSNFFPLWQTNKYEWRLYQSGELGRIPTNTNGVEWKRLRCRILHFPFNSMTKRENTLENTLVIGIKEIWSKVYKWAMCAKNQSKFLESRIFSSFLSLVKVFSSKGLVKISVNWSLVLI
jgi:hypothetical protein